MRERTPAEHRPCLSLWVFTILITVHSAMEVNQWQNSLKWGKGQWQIRKPGMNVWFGNRLSLTVSSGIFVKEPALNVKWAVYRRLLAGSAHICWQLMSFTHTHTKKCVKLITLRSLMVIESQQHVLVKSNKEFCSAPRWTFHAGGKKEQQTSRQRGKRSTVTPIYTHNSLWRLQNTDCAHVSVSCYSLFCDLNNVKRCND